MRFNAARWPQGSFCRNKILHQSCPMGFPLGQMKMDVGDDGPAHEGRTNVKGGKIHHVYLQFCCLNSGPLNVPTELPAISPFLLYDRVCQPVQGMRVYEEFLRFDTECRTNRDNVINSHLKVDWPVSVIKFHLCYYTKK